MTEAYLPPFYADLYDAAVRSAEFRKQRTAGAPAGSPWAFVVPMNPGDFHRVFNMLSCWVFEGEPGVPGHDDGIPVPEGSQAPPPPPPAADPEAALPPEVSISEDATRAAERYGTILAELPQVRARACFLRFAIAYNAGWVPAHFWLRKATVGPHHHDRHPIADAAPPMGVVCSHEWGFAKSVDGLDNARRADEAFGYVACQLSQQLWPELPEEVNMPPPPSAYEGRGRGRGGRGGRG